MSALDPSYLRSIRDGILSGTIESNNIEALPDGLVGLYDKELFPPTLKWKERKETLKFFLVFALAQKEISADFAAEILGDEWYNIFDENSSKEDNRLHRVNELIQLHSKRFSSAGGGKYRLYHERFRVYVLQKVSEKDITQFNAKFIALCEMALETISEKNIPEKESYALEFISTHFFIVAMQGETECLHNEQAEALKKYAYDQQFWERQIKASKGFEWSKRMLNEMMAWASKFNEDDEVIECALNKVDLYHKEQNDAPRIVQLVADGDIETALERIEKFGGEDKEGLQRKFILYMLCLMELTLLDSKDIVHAKASIERILKHLDEHIKFNYLELNLNYFMSPNLIFLLCSKLELIGVPFHDLNSLLSNWDFSWIINNRPFNDNQIQSVGKTIDNIVDVDQKDAAYMKYAKLLMFQGETEKAAFVVSLIQNNTQKAKALTELSTDFWNINEDVRVNELLENVHELLKKCVDEDCENEIKSSLAIELSKQLKFEEAIGLTGIDIRECNTGITRRSIKCYTLLSIAVQLVENGHIDYALEIADLIGELSPLIVSLAKYYSQNGQIQKAFELEEIYYLSEGEKEIIRENVIDTIENKKIETSLEVCTSGFYEEALSLIEEITHEKNVFYGYKRFAERLHSMGSFDKCSSAIDKAIDCLRWGVFDLNKSISLQIELISFLKNIGHERFDNQFQSAIMSLNKLVSRGQLKQAQELINGIPNELHVELTRELIFSAFQQDDKVLLVKNCKFWLAEKFPYEKTFQLLLCEQINIQIEDIISVFDKICEKIIAENQINLIDLILEQINNNDCKLPFYIRIAKEFFHKGDFSYYLRYLNKIDDEEPRKAIQKEMLISTQKSSSIRFYISELDRCIENAEDRNDRFIELFECLSDIGNSDELYFVSNLVLKNIVFLTDDRQKVDSYIKLSDHLKLYGYEHEANECFNESLILAQNSDEFEQDQLINQVATKFARIGNIEFAIKLLDKVVLFEPYQRLDTLHEIAIALINNGRFPEAYELVNKSDFSNLACEIFYSKIAIYLIVREEFDEFNKLVAKFSEYPSKLMVKKAVHLYKSGQTKKLNEVVFELEALGERYISEFLLEILNETNYEEIILQAKDFKDVYIRNATISDLSILLCQRGIFTTAIELMNEISYVRMLNVSLKEFLKQIETLETLNTLKLIMNLLKKTSYLIDFQILAETVKLALKINDKEIITILSKSQDSLNFKEKYFYTVGEMIYFANDFKFLSDNIFSENEQYLMRLGYFEKANVDLFNKIKTVELIKMFNRNEKINRIILYKYSLANLFAGIKIPDRYNRTLNLQWAIDIKNQLPN